ncbi:histidine phosphatase family protein [Azospirillum halopraeferens]|uniref:histidine phosphatase family protein n=1 Tax=Azospirillum halopraeferens TaxID=34010 RepID=UPI000401EF76|nr:histidine phosphatase family protein [Azospirillum halopraeferens]
MTTLHLIRHGDHDWIGRGLAARLDVPLNEEGRAQAAALARHYRGRRVDAVWASPLRRTVETATPVADALGLELRTADALLEVDFGAWSGRSFADLEEDPEWRRWNGARSRVRAPGGETIAEVQARAVGFLNRLCDDDPGGVHVVVGHGDPIRAVLAYYLGVPIDLFLRIEVSPAAISVLSVDGWGPRVLHVNASIDDRKIGAGP